MVILGALTLFPILMAYAASSDLLTMTISNWVSILLVAGFLVLALIIRLPATDVLLNLSCAIAVLSLTFALFCFGWIGGGDAKLAAATAAWVGWGHILDYGLVASVLGGLLTLGLLTSRAFRLPDWARMAWLERLHDPKSGIPYGIALAVAGLLVYPTTQVWLSASGG